MTIKDLLRQGTEFLSKPSKSSYISSPGLDAALLLAEVLHVRREELYLQNEKNTSEAEKKKYFSFLKKRQKGVCVAYILGRKEFRGLDFIVNPHVLVPRPESEILVEIALDYINSINKEKNMEKFSALDLCTGSGAIAISLKNECPSLFVHASDISQKALYTAEKNVAKLLKSCTKEKKAVNFIKSDLFKNIQKLDTRFQLIVSNPPYITTEEIKSLAPEVRKEPKLALDGGRDGLILIEKIIKKAHDFLVKGGRLFLEAAPSQMQSIKKMLLQNTYTNIMIHKDLTGSERFISAE